MKRYRIMNRITKEWWEGEANSAQEACQKAGWLDCGEWSSRTVEKSCSKGGPAMKPQQPSMFAETDFVDPSAFLEIEGIAGDIIRVLPEWIIVVSLIPQVTGGTSWYLTYTPQNHVGDSVPISDRSAARLAAHRYPFKCSCLHPFYIRMPSPGHVFLFCSRVDCDYRKKAIQLDL